MKDLSFVFMIFAGIGVVNGIFLSFYYLWRRKSLSDVFLAGLLLSLSLRIGKSIFMKMTDEINYSVLQVGLSACVFIGPFYYSYIKSKGNNQQKISAKDWATFIPLIIAIIIVGMIYPYQDAPRIWNHYIVQSIYAVWLIFVCLGLYELKKAYKKNDLAIADKKFLLWFSAGITFITLTYHFAMYIKGFTYMWGSYIFTFIFYYLGWLELSKLGAKHKTKKTNNALTPEMSATFSEIDKRVESEKLFKNPKLRLDDIAKLAAIDRNVLSKMVNEIYPHGFAHYINSKRIEEAIKLLGTSDQYSIEGIGFESGFNSKSSFFATFKKSTGKTPTQYKKELVKAANYS